MYCIHAKKRRNDTGLKSLGYDIQGKKRERTRRRGVINECGAYSVMSCSCRRDVWREKYTCGDVSLGFVNGTCVTTTPCRAHNGFSTVTLHRKRDGKKRFALMTSWPLMIYSVEDSHFLFFKRDWGKTGCVSVNKDVGLVVIFWASPVIPSFSGPFQTGTMKIRAKTPWLTLGERRKFVGCSRRWVSPGHSCLPKQPQKRTKLNAK